MNSKYSFILATILGLTIAFIPKIEPFPIILGLIYFLSGSLFGFIWPKESWHWGIWIAGPMVILVALSVLFTGQMEMFLKKDLPLLLLAISSSCLGSFLLGWFKHRRIKVNEK